jgi:hypothetical protein
MSYKDTLVLWSIIGAVGIGGWIWLSNEWEKLSEEEKLALAYSAALPRGVGDWRQQLLSFYARVRGTFQPGILPEPGITTTIDRPAVEGKYLGPPKNALKVSGLIRTVENQDPRAENTIEVPLFADTMLIDAAIENQSEYARHGQLKARALIGLIGSTPYFIESPPIDLQPGEFRQVTMRVPLDYGKRGAYDIAIQWAGYTLDRVVFHAVS